MAQETKITLSIPLMEAGGLSSGAIQVFEYDLLITGIFPCSGLVEDTTKIRLRKKYVIAQKLSIHAKILPKQPLSFVQPNDIFIDNNEVKWVYSGGCFITTGGPENMFSGQINSLKLIYTAYTERTA